MPGPARSEGIVAFLKGVASRPDVAAVVAEAEFFAGARGDRQHGGVPRQPVVGDDQGAAIRVEGSLINSLT